MDSVQNSAHKILISEHPYELEKTKKFIFACKNSVLQHIWQVFCLMVTAVSKSCKYKQLNFSGGRKLFEKCILAWIKYEVIFL